MKIRRINKRGFLLASQVVKIVIAVICIVFLVYFLTALYFSKIKEEKGRQAAETLESPNVVQKIVDSRTPKGPQTIKMVTPIGWYLFTFAGRESIPSACGGESCICICSNVLRYGFGTLYGKSERDRQAEECDESGACLNIPDLEDKYMEKEITKKAGLTMTAKFENNLIKLQ